MSIAGVNTSTQFQQVQDAQQKPSGGHGGRRGHFSLAETTTAQVATQQTSATAPRAPVLKARYMAKGKSESQADYQSSDEQQSGVQNNRAVRGNGSYVDVMA